MAFNENAFIPRQPVAPPDFLGVVG